MFNHTYPQSEIVTSFLTFPLESPNFSIFIINAIPYLILPKTTCFPFNHYVLFVQIKNYDEFVFGPALAIDINPGTVCLWMKFSSSNLVPYIDSPPVPSPFVISPPYITKSGIILWNLDPLKCNGFPNFPVPFSPVHRHLKFSAVFGTSEEYNSMTTLP